MKNCLPKIKCKKSKKAKGKLNQKDVDLSNKVTKHPLTYILSIREFEWT